MISNFDKVKEIMPLAEIYVHEGDNANQINGFILKNTLTIIYVYANLHT